MPLLSWQTPKQDQTNRYDNREYRRICWCQFVYFLLDAAVRCWRYLKQKQAHQPDTALTWAMTDHQSPLEEIFDESATATETLEAAASNAAKPKTEDRAEEEQKKKRKFSEEQDDADHSEDAQQETKQNSTPAKRKKIKPNFFISWRVSSPEIRSGVKSVQKAIIDHTKGLKGAEIRLGTLHITLMVMRLEGDEQINQAKAALENCRSGICSILEKESGERMAKCEEDTGRQGNVSETASVVSSDKLSAPKVELTFSGLGTFPGNKVLFAKLASEHETLLLKSVANVVRESFASKGIFSTDKRAFQPHLTVMKTYRESRPNFRGRVMKIPKESYPDFHDQEFGKESLTELLLCSMTHPWENGFYKVFGTLPKLSPRIP